MAKTPAPASASSPPRTVAVSHVLLIGGALALGALVWLGVQWSRTPTQPTAAEPSPKGPTVPQASPAGDQKPVPKAEARLSEAERRVEAEALQALKALQSVTTAGVNYNEYLRRVLDAKIQVDRYAQGDGGNEDVKGKMQEAMALYVFAKDAWSVRVTKEGYDDLAGRPEVDLCPQLKVDIKEAIEDWMRQGQDRWPRREEYARGFKIAYSQPRLWQCASERVAETDQALKTRP